MWLDEVAGTPHLSAEVKVLLLTMGRWMDENGFVSIPRKDLARILRCAERRVSSKYQTAIGSGFLERIKVGSRGGAAEFQGRIPGVRPPERVTPTSTLSPDLKGDAQGVTQSNGKGGHPGRHPLSEPLIRNRARAHSNADPSTPNEHQSAHGDPHVVAGLFEDEKPSLRSKKTPARKRAEPAEDPTFDRFWSTYPRRVAKPAARKAWAAAMKRGADPEQIIAAARLYATNPRRQESDPKYTAHPATWLNQERYDDEPEESWQPPAPRTNSARDEKYLKHQALREELFGARTSGPTLNVIRGELA